MSETNLISEEQIAIAGVTFLVRVHFNENKTWQGTIQCLEIRKTKHFRSLLELILLMNEAITSDKPVSGNPWTKDEVTS